MKKVILITIMACGWFAAKAQIPQPDPDTTARHFLIVASIDNLQEVTNGRLAAQKGKHAEVRSFGQMMVKDHGAAEQQLLQLAKSRGIDIPPAASGGIQQDINLKNATDNFDWLYIHAMESGHNSTIGMFKTYATNGKDPAVKAFAAQMLPTLESHLGAIKTIDKQLNNAGK